jgi:hypothetical protein
LQNTRGNTGLSIAANTGAGSTEPLEQGKDLSWEPLRPELVVEVAYDHMQGSRFRHLAQFRRWRKDKNPSDCTYDQLEVVPPQELSEIFGRAEFLTFRRKSQVRKGGLPRICRGYQQ